MAHFGTREKDAGAARKAPTVWAIAGGKGGVGKSVVASSLAIAFSMRGHRCAVIDLDLGAANQHTLLGVAAPRYTLSDFLDRKVSDLSDVLCRTPFANLLLASGSRALLDMANPKYSQKEKILRHIRGLDVDHVFLDLSAGCAFNALDFFLAAEYGIAVVVPERTSIENTQNFLKTAFFRSLRKVAKHKPLRDAIVRVLDSGKVRSARELIRGVGVIDAEAGRVLAGRAAAFAPMLVVNQLESSAERQRCNEIALACRHYLAARVCERGALPRDQRVRDAVAQGGHVLSLYPGARFSVALHALAADLMRAEPAQSLRTIPGPDEGPDSLRCPLPPLDVSAPGAYLRRCRERRGWSLEVVERRTRIRSLASIEGERFEELPPERYVVAFVRQYAQSLGIAEFQYLTEHYVQRYRAARVAD
jgi:flagellar biosynthesis protein FlhG